MFSQESCLLSGVFVVTELLVSGTHNLSSYNLKFLISASVYRFCHPPVIQWYTQNLPDGGANPQPIVLAIFFRKLHENERNWLMDGGMRVPQMDSYLHRRVRLRLYPGWTAV